MNTEEMAQHIQDQYNALVVDGHMFPATPQELAAIITRVNDGTISRAAGKIVLNKLAERNKAFIEAVHRLAKEKAND